MQLSGKKGVRYTGGRYEFILKLEQGSFNPNNIVSGFSAIAGHITGDQYFVFHKEKDNNFYLSRYNAQIGKQDFFNHDSKKIANFNFKKTICPKMIQAKVRASKNLTRIEYNTLDKILEAFFGKFERIEGYGPEDSNQQESQPYHHKQANLFQLD